MNHSANPTITWETVIFATLTQPNATPLQLSTGEAGLVHLEALEQFLTRACLRWKVHLQAHIGWEDEINQQSHLLIQVPQYERLEWEQNRDRFNPNEAWNWRLDWQDYDVSRSGDVWSYVTQKHTYLLTSRCPQRGVCRRRRCSYI